MPLQGPPVADALAIQMALQKRLRALNTSSPLGPMFPGADRFPPGRFPPIMPLPPIAGMRLPRVAPSMPWQIRSYQPLGRY